jgi:hypothetical protein
MIEKHYGKYIRNDSDEQLGRMVAGRTETETLGETIEGRAGRDHSEPTEKLREKVGGPTWIRTRTGRKRAPVSKHTQFLNFFAEVAFAAAKLLIPKRPASHSKRS